jgi:hypothetical protein
VCSRTTTTAALAATGVAAYGGVGMGDDDSGGGNASGRVTLSDGAPKGDSVRSRAKSWGGGAE